MIYVTGDTHIPGDIHKLSSKRFKPTKDTAAYLIICGDFGGVWDNGKEEKYWLKWLDSKDFITLFVDGNHENFELLYQFPTVEMFGGRVRKISPKVYHLMRGQVYTIEGKRFFTFGGAASHDREYRKEGLNWWKEELPNEKELEEARANLKATDLKVDCVITHCAPLSLQNALAPQYANNALTDFLEEVKEKLEYKKWFFGHYHTDRIIDGKHCALFERVVPIEI